MKVSIHRANTIVPFLTFVHEIEASKFSKVFVCKIGTILISKIATIAFIWFRLTAIGKADLLNTLYFNVLALEMKTNVNRAAMIPTWLFKLCR